MTESDSQVPWLAAYALGLAVSRYDLDEGARLLTMVSAHPEQLVEAKTRLADLAVSDPASRHEALRFFQAAEGRAAGRT